MIQHQGREINHSVILPMQCTGCWWTSEHKIRISVRNHIACEWNSQDSLQSTAAFTRCLHVVGANVLSNRVPCLKLSIATSDSTRCCCCLVIDLDGKQLTLPCPLRHFQGKGVSGTPAGRVARSNLVAALKKNERRQLIDPSTSGDEKAYR